jgi:hypothetical protein
MDVQYLRTDYFYNGEYSKPPVITVVSSKNDLQDYYEKHRKRIYGENGTLLPDNNFLNAIEKYSDTYFSNNFLLIIGLIEGSGSNRHKVEKIEGNGTIVIKRLLPEMGTADMAAWSIIIELDRNSKAKQYSAILIDEYVY